MKNKKFFTILIAILPIVVLLVLAALFVKPRKPTGTVTKITPQVSRTVSITPTYPPVQMDEKLLKIQNELNDLEQNLNKIDLSETSLVPPILDLIIAIPALK